MYGKQISIGERDSYKISKSIGRIYNLNEIHVFNISCTINENCVSYLGKKKIELIHGCGFYHLATETTCLNCVAYQFLFQVSLSRYIVFTKKR